MVREPAIEVIALATSDGFPVVSMARNPDQCAEDKMAAAASTLHSVSNAVAKQVLSSQFQTTFVEALDGNMAFVSIEKGDKDFVLMMSAGNQVNIAKLRMLIQRLAKEILNISL